MENSRLASLLTIITVLITALAILSLAAGWGLFAEHLVVGGVALVAWLRWSRHPHAERPGVVAPYILSVVALLVLNAFRLAADYPAFLTGTYPALFTGHLPLDHTNWFLLYVCAPVSLLLLGGYFLSRFTVLGGFFAWWGFAYGVAEALLQFKLELGSPLAYAHHYFGGVTAR
jgi:hypothetical protein